MICAEARPLIDAYVDRELDLSAALGMERHLESCPLCASALREAESLHREMEGVDLNFATDSILQRVRDSVEREADLRGAAARRPAWRFASYVTAAAALVVLSSFLTLRVARRGNSIDDEMVDIHLHSLIGDHLIDVPSSDRHTVKPWFQGKIDFSPPVPDLSAAGFVLAGGRVDVIEGSKVAVLIYKRRDHIINLWISPGDEAESDMREIHGYHVMTWARNGMTYRTVSDVDPEELRVFHQAFEVQTEGSATVH
jgi:anti-sigma factor RsiW